MGDRKSFQKRIRIFCIIGVGACSCLIFAKYVVTHLNFSESIHPAVCRMMDEMDIHGCTLTRLGSYDDIHVSIEVPVITEEEYSEEIRRQREETDASELTDGQIRENFLEEKKIQSLMQARGEVMDTLLSRCRFRLDEEEVAIYSKEIVHNYESEAMLYDMDVEQYREEILGLTKEEFYKTCYQEGEEAIKTYLVIGAIAQKEFSDLAQNTEAENAYVLYQEMENAVYSYFIDVDKDF